MASPARPLLRAAARTAGLGALAGASALGYATLVEVRWFVLRRVTLPVLPAGHDPLRVLHVSDLHLTPSQGRKRDWIAGLAALQPDLVVNTGDNLAHQESVPVLLDALGPLLDVPGVFVFGSNDYFAPSLRNPVRYLLPDDGQRNVHTPRLPYGDLRAGFERSGWIDLTNRRDQLVVDRTSIAFAGVDDPHLGYDDLASVAGPADAEADVRLGVHARAVPPGARPVRRRRLRRPSWPVTPTAASCACRSPGPSSPTATSIAREPGACTGTRRTPPRAPPAARGCTSPRGSGRRRTPPRASAVAPRRPCSRSPRRPEPRAGGGSSRTALPVS